MAKVGDVALFIGKKYSILDESIEFFTDSEYTHSGFYISDCEIIEAWITGVRVRDMHGITGYDVFTLKAPRTQEQINKGVEYAKSKLKIRYNVLALLGIVIEKITGEHHNIFFSKYEEICSELVSEIVNIMGDDLCPTIEDASTTPGDIGSSSELIKTESHPKLP